MKYLALYGIKDIRFEYVNKPIIENESVVIVKVKMVGICEFDISGYNKKGPSIEGMISILEIVGLFAKKIVPISNYVVLNQY